MKSGIYRIVCNANNSEYIGSSLDVQKRIRKHFQSLDSGKHENEKLQNAYAKYGPDAFHAEPLHFCYPDELVSAEFSEITSRDESGIRLFNIVMSPDDNRNASTKRYYSDEQYRDRVSRRKRESWANDEARRIAHIERMNARWADETKRKEAGKFFVALWGREDMRSKKSEAARKTMIERYKDPDQRRLAGEILNGSLTPEKRAEIARLGGIAAWADPDRKARMILARKEHAARPEIIERNAELLKHATEKSQTREARAKAASSMRARYQDPEFANKMRKTHQANGETAAQRMRAKWADPEYRAMQMAARRDRKKPISSQATAPKEAEEGSTTRDRAKAVMSPRVPYPGNGIIPGDDIV